jgi:hypothetical protein
MCRNAWADCSLEARNSKMPRMPIRAAPGSLAPQASVYAKRRIVARPAITDDSLSVIVIRGAFTDHPLPTGGATVADWPARVIAAATKPDAFTSSTKSRTKAVPSKRPLRVPIACGMLPPMIA